MDSGVSDHTTLSHFQGSLPSRGLHVHKLYAAFNYVYSYVAPSCILYIWNCAKKEIENRLDCSKLIPCSESLKSIAIDEHLSPGKCQISSMAVLNNELYIGTTWGCLIIVERTTLRPITVFRPFEESVSVLFFLTKTTINSFFHYFEFQLLCVIPLPPIGTSPIPLLVTIGRGYRSLIDRYTDSKTVNVSTPVQTSSNSTLADKHTREFLQRSRTNNMHCLLWRADHWVPL